MKKQDRTVAIPHPEWKDFATQPNFVPAPLELTTEIRPLNLVPESALPASQLGVPPPGGFFSQYLGDQNSNTPLRTLSSPHQPNRHARALPTSAAVAPPAAPASAPPPLMNLPLLFSLPPAAAASLPPPPPPTDPVPRMNADAIDNARQFALAIRTLNREHQHSASPPMQQKCDLHEPPIEQLCASRGIDLFPITFTPSNAPRDPSVTPTIPPAGVCLFASLHTDLLRFILQNYFGLLDQLILRLVCKRWLETLRGTRMQLNLVDCGYFLSEHFRLPLLINTFPNARELRISFGPKPSSKMSRRKPRHFLRGVNDSDIQTLSQWTPLLSLDLAVEDVTHLAFATFSQLTRLQSLRLAFMSTWENGAADQIVAHIGKVTSLTSLTLRMTSITSASIPSLSSLVNLQSLDLGWSEGLTRLSALTLLTSLEVLTLMGCGTTSADEFTQLLSLPRLRHATLPHDDLLLDAYDEMRRLSQGRITIAIASQVTQLPVNNSNKKQ